MVKCFDDGVHQLFGHLTIFIPRLTPANPGGPLARPRLFAGVGPPVRLVGLAGVPMVRSGLHGTDAPPQNRPRPISHARKGQDARAA